jgi:hypothetical protein
MTVSHFFPATATYKFVKVADTLLPNVADPNGRPTVFHGDRPQRL